MKVYISGKITGLNPEEVKEKFDAAKKYLHHQGHDPISPLDNGCNTDEWCENMFACLKMLMKCDAIYLLSDWDNSSGAVVERVFAMKGNKHIIEQKIN